MRRQLEGSLGLTRVELGLELGLQQSWKRPEMLDQAQ